MCVFKSCFRRLEVVNFVTLFFFVVFFFFVVVVVF